MDITFEVEEEGTMGVTLFCYEVHKNAGLANDNVTGENAKAYTKVEFDFKRRLSDEEYKKKHEQEVVAMLSKKLNIKEEHFKPISIIEYFDNHEDEEC